MRLRVLFLAAVLPLAAAASSLIAVSTLPNFLCGHSQTANCAHSHPQPIRQSSLPSILNHLSSHTSAPDLPLAKSATAPELVVLITSHVMTNPTALIEKLASAIDGASSFQARTDRDATEADLWAMSARVIPSVERLAALASDSDEKILDNGVADVVTISVDEDDSRLVSAVRKLSERTGAKLALLWTTRDGAEAGKDDNGAEQPANVPEEKAEDNPTGNVVQKSENSMNAPEITAAQLSGLLVVLLFLIIFIPGFMCLWNIQPPQSFEIFDGNDMKKKMQ